MKITLVSDAIYPWHTGGKEVRYHELAAGLKARGYELEIATMNWWGQEEPDDGIRYRALAPRIPMYTDGKRSMRQGILFAGACLRLLRSDADVIEADHMPYLQLFPLWLVAKIRRIPLSVTWHEYWGRDGWDNYLGGVAGRIAALIEKAASKLPTRIVAVSEATAADLRRAGVRPERLTLAANGVAARAGENARSGMVAVGRLIGHKRFDVAVRAAAELKSMGRPETLHIVGEGPERENLEKLASEAGVCELVRFHGTLATQEDLWHLVASSKVLIAPSEREGYGLAVAEAMHLGTPAVVSDHPDNASRDLVNPETGRVARAGDPASFAEAAVHAMELSSETVKGGIAGTVTGWSEMVDHYENIYRELAARTRRGRRTR